MVVLVVLPKVVIFGIKVFLSHFKVDFDVVKRARIVFQKLFD